MICANCGDSSRDRKTKYCSNKCKVRYNNRKSKGRDLSIFEASPPIQKLCPIIKCPECSKDFKAKGGQGARKDKLQTYCSIDCSRLAITNISMNKTDVSSSICKMKGLTKKLKRFNKNIRALTDRRTCKCGEAITTRTKSGMISFSCAKCRVEAIRASKRNSKRWNRLNSHKKRADYYGVRYEPVDREGVFNSCGWSCACCRVLCPIELNGGYTDDAPELDHITPISKGGDHIISNLQLLCRKCNSLKGNKVDYIGLFGVNTISPEFNYSLG